MPTTAMPTTTSSNKSPHATAIAAKLQAAESLAYADLSNQDLYAIALNQANLEQTNFSGSILTGNYFYMMSQSK